MLHDDYMRVSPAMRMKSGEGCMPGLMTKDC
jgi:hypothetical protein